MLDEVHYDKDLGERFADNYFADANDIVVSAGHKGVYFAEGGNGKPVLLLVKLKLLQGDDVACLLFSCTKNDTIRAFFYRVESFITVDRARGREGRMICSWWGEYAWGGSL